MNTRKYGGVLFLLAIVTSIISITIYNYPEAVLLTVSIFVFGLYLIYTLDERAKPHITINDWILGNFPEVSDLSKQQAERRLNIIRYKTEDGSFKIRFVFKRRFSSETIQEYKKRLKQQTSD